jgi:lipoyl(octanoyl) transferase
MSPQPDAILFEARHPVSFEHGFRAQRALQRRLLQDPKAADAVLLLEHEPCYTLGRGASPSHLLFDPAMPPFPLVRTDRGGEVTHHAPGQLVLYPVLNLQRYGRDLHVYMRQLEQVVIDLLLELGLEGQRIAGLTGVWHRQQKLAAIGVGARRWITQHGLALNVDCSLAGFSAIVPCGIADRAVGRLCDRVPGVTATQLRQPLLRCFADRFQIVLRPPQAHEVLQGW